MPGGGNRGSRPWVPPRPAARSWDVPFPDAVTGDAGEGPAQGAREGQTRGGGTPAFRPHWAQGVWWPGRTSPRAGDPPHPPPITPVTPSLPVTASGCQNAVSAILRPWTSWWCRPPEAGPLRPQFPHLSNGCDGGDEPALPL